MSVQLADRTINRIAIIDDQADVRASYEFNVEDLGLESVSEAGPLDSLVNVVAGMAGKSDAAICDYNLKVRDYSTFNGAELVAELYKTFFPALLCTKWHTASIDEMRQFRRYIPTLIDPAALDPSSIRDGLEVCIREFGGDFAPIRKPWRALIRVEDVRGSQGTPFVYVIIPSWNTKEVVRLTKEVFPPELFPRLRPGARLHARINLGAESHEELFFEEWEV
jgi:CheY-like chemotaxis protein